MDSADTPRQVLSTSGLVDPHIHKMPTLYPQETRLPITLHLRQNRIILYEISEQPQHIGFLPNLSLRGVRRIEWCTEGLV